MPKQRCDCIKTDLYVQEREEYSFIYFSFYANMYFYTDKIYCVIGFVNFLTI